MIHTGAAATSPYEDPWPTAQRPRLDVLASDSAPEVPALGANPLPAADIARLPKAARHRISAYIHMQLAALEEMPDPL
ncbi:hypothetical protein [Nocardia stercoris]|uniref:Uncharacterized protein n=1 Tax=Nocardia stercoris TaxID=2483361 RepID=A0A3M2L6L6_9NOCA|nr:hypothetical protein [Nocardia stercoris]RMI33299.1 hypothetical protein EBN03_08965 [Nocardia stercoris]